MSKAGSRFHLRAAALTVAATLLASCGGGGVSSAPRPIPTPMPTPTPAPTTTPGPTPSASSTPAAFFQTPEYNRSDGPEFHNAITAWQRGVAGQGVTIAVIDTGIDSDSPEFIGRISSASKDVAGNRGINGEDDHGTNVAMVAAAARDNTGIMGIAYQATILALRADNPGSCATETPSDPKSGCEFFDKAIAAGVDHAVASGAKVINLSLGGSVPEPVMLSAIQRAANAGVVIVVSAGNDGASTDAAINPNNPDPFAAGLRAAGNGKVIIAGSVNASGILSDFSNRAGTEADWFLAARGEGICCIYENGVLKVTTQSGGNFVNLFSGTSFSAPQIAGAAALLFQAFPNLTATQVVDLLLRTARDAGAAGTDIRYGRGILDIANAFAPQGTTSIAGTTLALPLGDTMLLTSGAMGDAAQGISLQTIVLDEYARAYSADLGPSLRSAQLAPRLATALAAQTRSLTLGNDNLALAFSIDARGRVAALPWSGQLRLSHQDADVAKVLAGRVVSRIAPGTTAGFAYQQGADGLVAQLQGRSQPAFLIAGSPLDDTGFLRGNEAGLAVRRQLGSLGLTLSAERAEALSGAPFIEARNAQQGRERDSVVRFGMAFDRQFGAIETSFGASLMDERTTILGARLHDGFGAAGAQSLLLDAAFGWRPAKDWRLGAAWRQGLTRARHSGLIAGGNLISNAWSIDAAHDGVFTAHDSLALRFSQPLRVESGALRFDLPVDYSYATLVTTSAERQFSLVPKGREMVSELAWRGSLWNGAASASLYYRKDPGHYASLPDDRGVAVSWVKKF